MVLDRHFILEHERGLRAWPALDPCLFLDDDGHALQRPSSALGIAAPRLVRHGAPLLQEQTGGAVDRGLLAFGGYGQHLEVVDRIQAAVAKAR